MKKKRGNYIAELRERERERGAAGLWGEDEKQGGRMKLTERGGVGRRRKGKKKAPLLQSQLDTSAKKPINFMLNHQADQA